MSPEDLKKIMPHAGMSRINTFAGPLTDAMAEFGIDTPLRQAAFLAQVAIESGYLTATVENLNYSVASLMSVWPSHFDADEAADYGRQPERIANRAYANRNGNGDEASGDGWKYRGRGLIQLTGLDNYRACGDGLGLDLVGSPELLEEPFNAARSAGWYWSVNRLNALADERDIVHISKRINGGTEGLGERLAAYHEAMGVLQC